VEEYDSSWLSGLAKEVVTKHKDTLIEEWTAFMSGSQAFFRDAVKSEIKDMSLALMGLTKDWSEYRLTSKNAELSPLGHTIRNLIEVQIEAAVKELDIVKYIRDRSGALRLAILAAVDNEMGSYQVRRKISDKLTDRIAVMFTEDFLATFTDDDLRNLARSGGNPKNDDLFDAAFDNWMHRNDKGGANTGDERRAQDAQVVFT